MAKSKHAPIRAYIPLDPGKGWRERKDDFSELWSSKDIIEIGERIEQLVYGMALDGIPMTVIADFFGVELKDMANLYGHVHRMAKAELHALAYRRLTDNGLNSAVPVHNIWFDKTVVGLSDTSGVNVSVDETGSNVNVTVNVVGGKKPEDTVDG